MEGKEKNTVDIIKVGYAIVFIPLKYNIFKVQNSVELQKVKTYLLFVLILSIECFDSCSEVIYF